MNKILLMNENAQRKAEIKHLREEIQRLKDSPRLKRHAPEVTERLESEENMERDPSGTNQHAKGAKLDLGKPPVRLILHSMPRAILAVSEVGEFGAAKYTENGWREVPNGIERYTDAMLRHALQEGIEEYDADSELRHAAQVAWNALARLELILRKSPNAEAQPPR